MSVLIEDSPRANLDGWISDCFSRSTCSGTVLSPFATPWEQIGGPGRKRNAETRAQRLHETRVPLWFDPMTHALQMSGVGDFRYYGQYDLWNPDRPGLLETAADRADHVRRVFAIQRTLGAVPLAPTVLLHTGLSDLSVTALELAREAKERDGDCWFTIAGSPSFWSSGGALDAHIGSLAGLEPRGWFFVSVKALTVWPVESDPREIFGLCRAARALGEDTPVHISHGDLAALPAIAAGASTVGSGWDKRQRVCSAADYAPRPDSTEGGGWLGRVTFKQLLGAVTGNEAEILQSQQPELVEFLGGLPVPAPRERFDAHLEILSDLVGEVAADADFRARFSRLDSYYRAASSLWPIVQEASGCPAGADAWIEPVASGLHLYAGGERFL